LKLNYVTTFIKESFVKIAIATSDGTQVSAHFGRSAGFVVFDLEGTAIKGRELRSNNHTPHAQGLCHGEHHDHAPHSHSNVVGLLRDCEVLLCGGMGSGAAQALNENGIRPRVLPTPCSVDNALQKFLSGAVAATDNVHCTCHS
jgi:predicted Fe-Mo cluster-binding NifX family protein